MNATKSRAGFTIPEVLVAIVILSVGILALMGTSVATQKLIGRARRVTLATQVADGILDSLRLEANANLTACTGLASNTTGYTNQGITVTWVVDSRYAVGNVGVRNVWVIATYSSVGRTMVDTITSAIKCDT